MPVFLEFKGALQEKQFYSMYMYNVLFSVLYSQLVCITCNDT